MPAVLCFDCGGMFEVTYDNPKPTKSCPKCQLKIFESQTSFEE
jgi:DNA-directed RNA polymerase subunit RPC12/RpoP